MKKYIKIKVRQIQIDSNSNSTIQGLLDQGKKQFIDYQNRVNMNKALSKAHSMVLENFVEKINTELEPLNIHFTHATSPEGLEGKEYTKYYLKYLINEHGSEVNNIYVFQIGECAKRDLGYIITLSQNSNLKGNVDYCKGHCGVTECFETYTVENALSKMEWDLKNHIFGMLKNKAVK